MLLALLLQLHHLPVPESPPWMGNPTQRKFDPTRPGSLPGFFNCAAIIQPGSNLIRCRCTEKHETRWTAESNQGICDKVLHVARDIALNLVENILLGTEIWKQKVDSMSFTLAFFDAPSVCQGTLAPAAFAFSSHSCLVIWSISPVKTMVMPDKPLSLEKTIHIYTPSPSISRK